MKKYLAFFGVVCAFAIPAAAIAAELDETKFTGLIALGDACTPGEDGAWYHFVNNQTGGAAAGELSATFSDASENVSGVDPLAVNQNVQHFYVFAESTLIDASTNLPGKLVLSHISCGKKTEDPRTLPEQEA